MEKDRLEWVLSGLDWKKLNQNEKQFLKKIEEKSPDDISRSDENRLEQIYQGKSR